MQLGLPGMVSCDEGGLEKVKQNAKREILERAPDFLEKVALEKKELKWKEGKSEILELMGGVLRVPARGKREEGPRQVGMVYPKVGLTMLKGVGGEVMAELPKEWGQDDLDKILMICLASGATIEEAKNVAEVKLAVAKLTSRAVVAPIGSFEKLTGVTGKGFEGLLTGGFEEKIRGVLIDVPR